MLPIPTEASEMLRVAQYLNARKIFWIHCPNEGRRSFRQGRMLKAQGMRAGVADVLILDGAPKFPECRGIAIELKRIKGGVVSPMQKQFLDDCEERNWVTYIAKGADDAIDFLQRLGFV